MITKVRITSGYAAELKHLKDHTFTFTPGLNVLFGENGCGKSSLLRILAAHSGIPGDVSGGWSKRVYVREGQDVAAAFAGKAPGRCGAEVEWDSTPSFLFDSARMNPRLNNAIIDNIDESSDGMTTAQEQMGLLMGGASEGQILLHKINKLAAMLKKVPDLRQGAQPDDPFVAYLDSLTSTGKTTLLMDEPDRSLSIPNQFYVWMDILSQLPLQKGYQIIVATHNPMVLLMPIPGMKNLISMQPGYTDVCRHILRSEFQCAALPPPAAAEPSVTPPAMPEPAAPPKKRAAPKETPK